MVREQLRKRDPIRTLPPMTATLIGYACCSTDRQDLAAQHQALLELGVAEDRIYTDHGLTGTTGWQGPSQIRAPSPIGFGNET